MMRGKGYRPDSIPLDRRTPFRHLGARLSGNLGQTNASLASLAPDVFDQGQSGACVGHARACAIKARLGLLLPFVPSPKGIYQVAIALDRADLSSVLLDGGAEPNQAVRGENEYGIHAIGKLAADGRYSDVDWPFPVDGSAGVVPEITLGELEADAADVLSSSYAITSTGAQRRDEIRTALTGGIPVTCAVDASDASSPVQSYTGGVLTSLGTMLDHYVCILGFDLEDGVDGGIVLTVRNSWGRAYGEQGDFRIAGAAIDQIGDLYAADVKLLGGAS